MAKQSNSDYYDENFDQDPRQDSVAPTKDESDSDEAGYATFLAPKSAFPESAREVGARHNTETVRVLDDELELRCLGKGNDKAKVTEEEDAMYS